MRRSTIVAVTLGGAVLMGLPAIPHGGPWLVWNASASAPVGFYRVVPGLAERGDLVLVRPPDLVAKLAAERGYLPHDVPLVKRVAAVAEDPVCIQSGVVFIRGKMAAQARTRDLAGRPLPRWQGCRTLRDDEVFLLLAAPDSFDSRYFGPVSRDLVIGRLAALWTR